MKIWIDAQLPPSIAPWITERFRVTAVAIRDLGLNTATDSEIFEKAHEANAIMMSKDRDFLELVRRKGTPPQIIWINSGNTSNQRLQQILEKTLEQALLRLKNGEPIVEIRGMAE